MAEHIALLGDSIFDNASYTKGQPDVVTHLRGLLPAGFKASLLAVDGSTTADLADQVSDIPSDVTRIVLSIGGNNARGRGCLARGSLRSNRVFFGFRR